MATVSIVEGGIGDVDAVWTYSEDGAVLGMQGADFEDVFSRVEDVVVEFVAGGSLECRCEG